MKKPASDVLPLDPAVRTGRLPNGFTYYIRHNGEPRHRVVLYLVNKAGAILEDEDQRGLAHFMEHMSFNGTKNFPHNELIDYLQKAGIRFGADINAYTSFDETVYQLPLPADRPDVLHKGLEIMHDWAQFATLDPKEIDRERGVVLEEKRLGKGAGERMQRRFWPVILAGSRYADRVPIGLDTVLNHFQRPAIARFYHDWYRPDLQALVVVGDINADSLERVVRAGFADLKNPAKERARTTYKVPLTGKGRFMVVTDPEMPVTQAELLIKQPGFSLRTKPDYRAMLIRNLFNGMIAGRYAEIARQAAPPFARASAEIQGFMGHTSILDVNVTAKAGELEQGLKAAWREVVRLQRYGFTQTELDRAKTAYLRNMQTALEEKDKTPSEAYVREYQALFLKGDAAPGIVQEYRLTDELLPGITLADLADLFKTYYASASRDMLVLAPDKEKGNLPDQARATGWLRQVEAEQLKPYVDEQSALPLLVQQPVAGRIASREKTAGVLKYTLSNGLKIVIKPTDFKNNELLFDGFASGGSSQATDADYESASAAAVVVAAGGAGNYNQTELSKFLEGKQLRVEPFVGERFQGFRGRLDKNDLETALQLVFAYFTEPRKDSAVFQSIIARSAVSLQNRATDPASVFKDTTSAVLGNYSPRRTGPSLAKLKQIGLDKAFAFYRSCFADAAGFTFVFTGSVDTAAVLPLLEKYLGGLPSAGHIAQARDLGIRTPEGRMEKKVFKGTEPKSTVMLVYSGRLPYSQGNNIRMDALKECLEIRLIERLREEESGVYSPGVFVTMSKYPESAYKFMIQFGCAPEHVDKLVRSAQDEVEKLRTQGPLAQNLEKWRAEDQTTTETQLRTNAFWEAYLVGQLQDGEPLDELDRYAALRDRVSVTDLKEMAGKYLDGHNLIRLVLLPEPAANAKAGAGK